MIKQPTLCAYYDYDPEVTVACSCGHRFRAEDAQEVHLNSDLLDITCPNCGAMTMVVVFPTLEEARTAAGAGNPKAQADLPRFEAQHAQREEAQRSLLVSPDELPALSGDHLVIDWDLIGTADADGHPWQLLVHDGVEIWREHGYFESWPRFEEVAAILKDRYGTRLRELRPTDRSDMWLYGDRFSSLATIAALNEALREANRTAYRDPQP